MNFPRTKPMGAINISGTHTGQMLSSRLPAPQRLATEVTGRMVMSRPLSDLQKGLLAQLVDDKLTLAGRTFSRADLMAIWSGHQFPRDPEVRKALGLPDGDYTGLETRVLALQSS